MWIISVEEQAPTGKSIFCKVSVKSNTGSATLTYGNSMYFVCDLNRNITQHFDWQKKEYKQQLEKLGYKF